MVLCLQGLLDLSWLAHACYTPKPPSAARLQAMQLAQEQGLEPPQGYQESWGLAGELVAVLAAVHCLHLAWYGLGHAAMCIRRVN